MNEDFDFGIDFSQDLDDVVDSADHKTAVQQIEELDKVLREVYHMVRPLLVKLTQNPEKVNIRWPGRSEQAEKFLAALDEKVSSVISIKDKKVKA